MSTVPRRFTPPARAGRHLLGAATAAALLAAPSLASAERAGNLTLDTFRPAMDSRGYITVNASQVLGHKEASIGIVTDWGRGLLSFEGGSCTDSDGNATSCTYDIDNMFTPTLIGAFGLKLGSVELELGASVPFVIMNGDRGPDYVGVASNPNDDQRFKLEGQGIGNIGLHLKTRFLKTSKGPKIGLGLIASAYLPTVSEKDRFLGESKVMPGVSVILDKEFGRERQLRLALNAGFRLRTETATFTQNDPDTTAQPAPTTGETIKTGSEIPFGLGVAYALSPKFDVVGEVFGAVPTGAENYMPLEAIAGIKLYLAKNSFLTLGGGRGLVPGKGANPTTRAFIGIVFEPSIGDRDGDGYKDDVDACPDQPEDFDDFEDADGCPEPDNDRDGILDEDDKCPLDPEDKDEFEDEDGCPEGNIGDRDGDGILDNVDQCPDDPEDKDEFEDEDGCPDPDNDKDGILDVDDLCPDDPEDFDKWEDEDGCPEIDNDKDRINDTVDACPNPLNGEPIETTQETVNGKDDEDGCPDRGRVIVTETGIEILDKVYFEHDKDVIMTKSYPILDAVAATLEGTTDITLVEIQGHTDEQGNDAYNLDLSQRRAASVRRYLIGKGIAEERLTSQGYGETQPIDTAHNKKAWATNRRVEFLILKRGTDS